MLWRRERGMTMLVETKVISDSIYYQSGVGSDAERKTFNFFFCCCCGDESAGGGVNRDDRG